MSHAQGSPEVIPTSMEPLSETAIVRKRRKISTATALFLVLYTLTIAAAVAFLQFLWSNPTGNNPSESWAAIVSKGFVLPSITFTTLVARTAVSAQAAICASMLASIILERRRVTIYGSAQLSTLRSSNPSPLDLMKALCGNYLGGSLWTLVASLLFTTTLLLQFASTVLVRDVSIGKLAAPDQDSLTLVGMSFDNLNLSDMSPSRQTPFWLETAKVFPTFAENKPQNESCSNHTDAIRDTCIVHRAFVPFLNSTVRTSIKQFNGTATVMDSRVVCVRPKIHEGLSVVLTEEWRWLLNGTLTPEEHPLGLILGDSPALTGDIANVTFSADEDGGQNITLNWTQEIPFAHDAGEWNIIQKTVHLGPALVSSLDPRYPDIISDKSLKFTMTNPHDSHEWGLSHYLDGDGISLMTGRSYVLINMTVVEYPSTLTDDSEPSDPKNFYFSPSQRQNKLILTPQNKWLVFSLPRVPNWHLSVSLCFDSFTSVDANVAITAEQPVAEPNLGVWDPHEETFDTKYIRQHLGVLEVGQNATGSRVMKLETSPEHLRDQVKIWYRNSQRKRLSEIVGHSQNLIRPFLKEKDKKGSLMCAKCGLKFFGDKDGPRMDYQVNNMVQQQIFQDVLSTTTNLAKAWQAFFTLIGLMAYYDRLPFFDVEDTIKISWYQSMHFPQRFYGLWAVIGALAAHVLLVIIITCCFVTMTEVSRVGDNIWQCIAQINYKDEDDILRSLTTKSDAEVKELLVKQDLHKQTVNLQIIEEDAGPRIGLRTRTTEGVLTKRTWLYQKLGNLVLAERQLY
ncbi:hypothetical protein F66182_763 [Fusarium sp. NRRL 66182]|nr:hypothetical protein F66182_763 [Fusarium sp. NRRL 66182]